MFDRSLRLLSAKSATPDHHALKTLAAGSQFMHKIMKENSKTGQTKIENEGYGMKKKIIRETRTSKKLLSLRENIVLLSSAKAFDRNLPKI